MKCARCSAEIPVQSQFCLRCGTPVRAAAPPPTGPALAAPAAAFPAPQRDNRLLVGVIVALLAAVAAMAGFLIHGALTQKPSSTGGGQLVQAPGTGGAGSLVQAPSPALPGAPVQAPADSNPNKVMQQPAAQVNVADIDDYLRFVKRIEATKQQMAHDLDARLTRMAVNTTVGGIKEGLRGTNDPSPAGDPSMSNITPEGTRSLSKDIEAQFNRLTSEFVQRVPPPNCVTLRDRYYKHLGLLQGRLVKLAGVFDEIQTDPSAALERVKRMQGQSGDIDDSADSADRALGEICRQYKLEKEFEIKGDKSPNSVEGFGGP